MEGRRWGDGDWSSGESAEAEFKGFGKTREERLFPGGGSVGAGQGDARGGTARAEEPLCAACQSEDVGAADRFGCS
jgi:hypothetical protein